MFPARAFTDTPTTNRYNANERNLTSKHLQFAALAIVTGPLRIGAAISHLESNCHEPVNLDQLAQIAHMSKRNFVRSFQAAMGNSPIAHLIQLRVNRSASLLRRTDLNATEIAFQVGFGDNNLFARQFHRLLGVTPRQYRQQNAQLQSATSGKAGKAGKAGGLS